ncbi:hypothetical protein EIK76_11760 [Rheinheimera mesophila]|uniref:DUF3718 domain-containing protein n=1 Tax=Rheinheimera mesophila TaxID=1547515 RepID=A0A3P3QGB5_9GAMM|nr:hypothetical protein [Rheinheimera mesophila]KKL01293.1 hypothetical protein SD53_10890 [Rheinheimera mesophila]RRJ20196.1 hypothetical protein EIK76_11760 [Rheinheimera mesophila]
MKFMTAAVFTLATLVVGQSQAASSYTYSNTEYCELVAANAADNLLKAYAKKLGFTPARTACVQLLNPMTAQVTQDAEAQIRAYSRGSARKLPASLIQQLKAMPEQQRRAALVQIYG